MDCFVIQYEFPVEMSVFLFSFSSSSSPTELYLARISFQNGAVCLQCIHVLNPMMKMHFLTYA